MTVRYYPAVIERDRFGFSVFFPDLPGCASGGDTVQAAARNAEEALQAHLELDAEHGDAIPAPSELDAVTMDDDVEEVARLLVRAEVPDRAVRVNITLPAELLAAVDRHAKAHGFSRSGLLAQAVREKLRDQGQTDKIAHMQQVVAEALEGGIDCQTMDDIEQAARREVGAGPAGRSQ